MIHQEWHVTVQPDAARFPSRFAAVRFWVEFCGQQGMKPLDIELSTMERQLMLASPFDPTMALEPFVTPTARDLADFSILRFKHEVEAPSNQLVQYPHATSLPITMDTVFETRPALYYECHLKFEGLMPTDRGKHVPFLASRDLLRDWRWYATKRSPQPFEPSSFYHQVTHWLELRLNTSRYVGQEYEAALIDTNPSLDAQWVGGHE